jgi:hypothetical protein
MAGFAPRMQDYGSPDFLRRIVVESIARMPVSLSKKDDG